MIGPLLFFGCFMTNKADVPRTTIHYCPQQEVTVTTLGRFWFLIEKSITFLFFLCLSFFIISCLGMKQKHLSFAFEALFVHLICLTCHLQLSSNDFLTFNPHPHFSTLLYFSCSFRLPHFPIQQQLNSKNCCHLFISIPTF